MSASNWRIGLLAVDREIAEVLDDARLAEDGVPDRVAGSVGSWMSAREVVLVRQLQRRRRACRATRPPSSSARRA